jgi:hypothetical protein
LTSIQHTIPNSHMILLGYLALGTMFAFVFLLVVATSERRR